MRALIARLANAESHEIRVVGDLVLYRTKPDETVRVEVMALGRKALPYLIEGMHDSNKHVRAECTKIAIRMPSRQVVMALIESMRDSRESDGALAGVHGLLHDITGHSTALPPSGLFPYDREGTLRVWVAWWEQNKGWLVDTQEGVGLLQEDGSVTRLPATEKKQAPKVGARAP
jgi:hypothetical protein